MVPDAGSPKFTVTAAYDSPLALVNYTQATQRGSPKSAPTLGTPTPLAIVAWKSEGEVDYDLAQLNTDHAATALWEVISVSQFNFIRRNSDDSWEHEEAHYKILSAIKNAP